MTNKVLSARSIAKVWGVSRKTAVSMLHRSHNWEMAEPMEVGSGKSKLNIWKYTERAIADGYSIDKDKQTK